MEQFIIAGTDSTPSIHLDSQTAKLEFRGRSVPDDAEAFYAEVLSWLDDFVQTSPARTEVTFNLEFFNIASSKRILFIMYKLNDLIDKGKEVVVNWCYIENDHDMLEVGQDYAFMVKLPFEFVRIKKPVPQAV